MSQAFAEPGPRERDGSPETRCSILVAAERLFREIGYRKTTVADIARALRMSPANVYRFFESKKAINEAVAERLIGELETQLAAVADRPGLAAAERLGLFLRTMSRLNTEHLTTERRMFEMVEVAMTESWEVVHHHIERIDRMICRIVADGAASGEFVVDDPLVAARCIHSAFVRFCHPALIAQCADEPGPSLDDMVAFLLRGLGVKAA